MRIVMTGGTSGIGLIAAKTFLARPGTDLIVATRDPGAAPAALSGATILRLDLASLTDVMRFAAQVGTKPIDVLILNAGLQVTKPQTSEDGFELTFAANHLAHHLLIRLLLPHLTSNARVILTGSGTHDPRQKTAMPPPHHADAEKLAFPGRDPERDASAAKGHRRAYSASKLCNIMTARELARRSADRPGLMVAAFDPAFVPGTGLTRDYPALIRWLVPRIVPLFSGRDHTSTPEVSGRHLAALATEPAYAGARGDYWSVIRHALVPEQPSALARDDAASARLWDDSVRLTGGAQGAP